MRGSLSRLRSRCARSGLSGRVALVVLAAPIVLLVLGACASRQAPLLEGMGPTHHPITTTSELAQRYFDQGLALSYGFNHREAERSFREVVRLDPKCAMGWWGVALVLGPNINDAMEEPAALRAYEAVRQALELAPEASEKEQAYIQALATRYAAQPPHDRMDLDVAYADAMRELALRYPEDLDAATLFAEALMDITPWDYWTKAGEPTRYTPEIVATLESVMEQDPYHPGACHFYIHAVEASKTPGRAEGAADRLADLVPGAGHLVHMPAHIYIRIGRYHDASLANVRAAAADESYINQCNAQGFYAAAYYPHNIHFLWASTMIEGRSQLSLETARKLVEYIPEEKLEELPFLEEFLPTPYYTLVRFGLWEQMLAEPPPDPRYQFAMGMWNYGRCLALLNTGRVAEVTPEHANLVSIGESDTMAHLTLFGGSNAATLLNIATHVVEARLAEEFDNPESMLAHLREASELQDGLPYTEPPPWYFALRQAIGNALLAEGSYAEAEAVYREELELSPLNGWSLHGLEKSLRGQGRLDEADAVAVVFEQAWAQADVKLGQFSSCCGAASR